MRGHHAQNPPPSLSCSGNVLKETAFSCSRAGLCCKKRLPLLMWFFFISSSAGPQTAAPQWQSPQWLFFLCFSLISLDLRLLLCSPVHTSHRHCTGDGTSGFDKQRNVLLWVASAEQSLIRNGFLFCPNMFPEVLSKLGKSLVGSQIGAYALCTLHFCFYLQTLRVFSGFLVWRRKCWPGSSDCPFNNNPCAASDI